MLGNFKGYLQIDGYSVYKKYGEKKNVNHVGCWAHARREYERVLENDNPGAEKASLMIQEVYAVERQAKQEELSAEQIKELRLEKSLSIINELGEWIFQEIKSTLPKSQPGKAMAFMHMPSGMHSQDTYMMEICRLIQINAKTPLDLVV